MTADKIAEQVSRSGVENDDLAQPNRLLRPPCQSANVRIERQSIVRSSNEDRPPPFWGLKQLNQLRNSQHAHMLGRRAQELSVCQRQCLKQVSGQLWTINPSATAPENVERQPSATSLVVYRGQCGGELTPRILLVHHESHGGLMVGLMVPYLEAVALRPSHNTV